MVWKGEVAIQRHYLCLYHLRRGTKQHCLNRVLVNRESISLKCDGQIGLNFFGRRVCQHSFCFQIDTQPIHQQLILKQLLCLKPLSSPQSVVGRLCLAGATIVSPVTSHTIPLHLLSKTFYNTKISENAK